MRQRKRGRPPFKPTATQKKTVQQMVSCGEAKATIARAIGIDVGTLEKHFADELETGLAVRRKEVIDLLFKSARKGNVTAQKQLENMTRLAQANARYRGDAPDEPEEPEEAPKQADAPRGKKQEAAARASAAAEAGGKYAPPVPPKLVVNNT